jgi:hypothetical protein
MLVRARLFAATFSQRADKELAVLQAGLESVLDAYESAAGSADVDLKASACRAHE